MTHLTHGRIRLAEFSRQTHVAVAPAGAKLDDILTPDFWVHVQSTIRAWDRIELRAEDGSWFADLVVTQSGMAFKVRPLTVINKDGKVLTLSTPQEVGTTSNALRAPKGYVIDYGGPLHRYRVVRKSDGEVLHYGMDEDEAIRWAIRHAAEQTGAPPAATPEPINDTPDGVPTLIPDNWEELHWKQQLKLAEEISGGPVIEAHGKTVTERARDIIAATVEARADDARNAA